LSVEVFRPAVVSLGRIEKGAKFTEGNVGLVRKPASSIPPGTVGDLRNILGRTAAVYVAPGTILRMHSIFDPPVVRRGSVVQALARRGSVELSVDAKALEDAKAGETVRVENTRTRKVLKGRVLDEKTVLLEGSGP
jgi:flagella basal body P-ring formation protein FlgA